MALTIKIFGGLLFVGFLINALGWTPQSAIQQQVQYQSWLISVSGLILFALGWIVGQIDRLIDTRPAATDPFKNE